MNNDLIFVQKPILSYCGSMQILFAGERIPLLILLHKTWLFKNEEI